MKKNKTIILMVSLALTVFLFAGCNMLRGAKRDVENAGDAVARGARDIKEDWDVDARNRTLGEMNRISDIGTQSRYSGMYGYTDSLLPNTSLARSGSLGVNHLVTLMGMGENDVNTVLGTGRLMNTNTTNGRTYTYNMFGRHADIDVDYDSNRQIRQIKVYVDNDQLTRWQTELNTRYGIPADNANNMWNANNTTIQMNPGDDRTEIVITRAV